jgi:hypothetical protein
MPEGGRPVDLSTPRLRWLAARMEARYALGDAYAMGTEGDALLALAHDLAHRAAARLDASDVSTLLGEPLLPREAQVKRLADRCYDELYGLACISGWYRVS